MTYDRASVMASIAAYHEAVALYQPSDDDLASLWAGPTTTSASGTASSADIGASQIGNFTEMANGATTSTGGAQHHAGIGPSEPHDIQDGAQPAAKEGSIHPQVGQETAQLKSPQDDAQLAVGGGFGEPTMTQGQVIAQPPKNEVTQPLSNEVTQPLSNENETDHAPNNQPLSTAGAQLLHTADAQASNSENGQAPNETAPALDNTSAQLPINESAQALINETAQPLDNAQGAPLNNAGNAVGGLGDMDVANPTVADLAVVAHLTHIPLSVLKYVFRRDEWGN